MLDIAAGCYGDSIARSPVGCRLAVVRGEVNDGRWAMVRVLVGR
jgi:hypothetical protein